MNLLFITHANLTRRPYGDGSTRYRCFNIADVALAHGHNAEVVELNRLRLRDLSRFDMISWLRPMPGKKALNVINTASTLNIPCVADVDDLIFDPDLAAESPAVCNGFASLPTIEKQFSAHADFLRLFNAITVSTNDLQGHVKRCFPKIPNATVHNGLSEHWLEYAQQLLDSRPASGKLGYLPGTRSHDQDFLSIRQPVTDWLKAMPDASLDIVGKIDISRYKGLSTRIRQHPWMDYYRLPAAMSQYCATLSPLTQSSFNRAKSHIKFIESAAVGVPVIASPNDDLTAHSCPGLLFPETMTQWCQALMEVSQAELRTSVSLSLRQYVRDHCTASHYATPLIQAWEAKQLIPQHQSIFPLSNAA